MGSESIVVGDATNIIQGGFLACGADSAVGNLFTQAYYPCFGGIGGINWRQASAQGALGAAGLKPFQLSSATGAIASEALSQSAESLIAGQF